MSLSAPDAAYREAASSLTPTAVSQYLAATKPWQLESRLDHVQEIWSLPGEAGKPIGRILLPLATDYADFSERFSDALHALSRLNGWGPDELVKHIAATQADLFFVRLDQVRDGETIPLKQAEATIDALYEMVKAAAISAAAPGRSQRGGRLPNVVSAFLENDVRLGHTKRGSFVFTVVTRLNRAPETSLSTPPGPDTAGTDIVPVFPRRVMETLARGLEATRDLTQGKSTVTVDQAIQSGLSAGLLESLEDIAGPEELRSLELSFLWAATETKPNVGAEPIRLEHAQVAQLARVREELLREEEPPRRETLVGMVKSLARDDESLESGDSGSVVISAEVNGRRRNVHLTLSGEGHAQAIECYRQRLPLIVTGDLVFERQAWRLVGNIEVGPSIALRTAPKIDQES
jgi:hypothetical protein